MAVPNDIIHFHYPVSPFAHRITWYLTLRGIPHAECIQPAYLPRPDLTTLGIHYRRIPLLSIGRSIYCDSRLILSKLETHFPSHASLTPPLNPVQLAIQQLLSSWTIDGGIFNRAAQALPSSLPLLRDAKFIQDREDYTGMAWTQRSREAVRPEALVHLQAAFEALEGGFLADGREWILGTEGPGVADIEVVWTFHWMILGVKDMLPADAFNAQKFPRVYAYVSRFDGAIREARGRMEKVKRLKGTEAVDFIWGAAYPDGDADGMIVDGNDPVGKGLRKGQLVASWPVDTGFRHRDVGKLVKLDKGEVVLEVNGEGGKTVRVHHPRWNFRVRAVADDAKL